MSAEAFPQPQENERIHDEQLAHMAALVIEAANRDDLPWAATEQAAATQLDNPNSAGSGFFVGHDVTTRTGNVYRQVGTEAIDDLGQSGIVRNGATAQGQPHRRWGHKVFWHQGKDGKELGVGGRTIIEADGEAAAKGWVTADQVKGIYAKDTDGRVKNILPSDK